MCNLGLAFLTNKMLKRYERSELMQKRGHNIHYINEVEKIKKNYNDLVSRCRVFKKMLLHKSI